MLAAAWFEAADGGGVAADDAAGGPRVRPRNDSIAGE